MMNRSPFPSVKYGSVSPNRFPFCSIANGKVLPNSADWSWPEASNKRGCHEKENHKTTPFKTILTPLWKRDCSPLHSSPSPRTTDEWSSHSEDEMSCVSLTNIEIVHARLDPSVSCSLCGASHTLYLMYPLIKTLDTWNESSKFLCSLCFAEEENRQDVGSSLPSDDTAPKPRAVAKRQQYRKTNTALISKSTCQVQPCLDVLHSVEDELELVATALSQDYRPPQDASTCRELPNQGQVEETKIHEELHSSNGHLQRHWDLLTDTVTVLQAALDQEGDDECDVLLAYYQWRERHRRDDTSSPAWKTQADRALDQRDNVVGVGPGHFWGGACFVDKPR